MNEPILFTVTDQAGTRISLPAPLEWEIVRSLDSPAHSFTGVFPYTRGYPLLFSIEVMWGEKRLFRGNLDETTAEAGENGFRLRLIARSKGGVLLDNEALPQTYANVRLNTLYARHIQPYGFPLVTDHDVFVNAYQVLKGMSEWEAVANFFRNATSATAYIDEDDRLICNNARPTGGSVAFSNRDAGAIRYSSLKSTDNRYSPITRFVIRDSDGFYSSIYDNPRNAELKLTRKRYLIPSLEYTLTPGTARLDAVLRVGRSMLGKQVVTVICPGLLVDIALFDNVTTDDGFTRLSGLAVHQIRLRGAPSGFTSTFTMVNRTFL